MKLCAKCETARDSKFFTPMHLVHPEHASLTLFDVRGMAVCPTCEAVWVRERNRAVLMERKPPERATRPLVEVKKSHKKVVSLRQAKEK